MRRTRSTALLLLACSLIACGEEAPPPQTAAVQTAPTEAAARSDWLGAHDRTPPAQWLLAHAGAAHRATGPAVDTAETVAVVLQTAAERYRENPRMIANRAVQLQTMLGEAGIDEDALTLLTVLARLPPANRVSFSADCQHYYNLRMQGLDREQALERLSAS